MPFIGSGAPLTALNASNLASGTVPTARLGSGTASSSTFLRGDNTWAAAGGGSTNFGDVGTYAVLVNVNTTSLAINGTVAGSSLRYNYTRTQYPSGNNFFGVNIFADILPVADFVGAYTNPNFSFAAGGTALSGTWRKVSSGVSYQSFTVNNGYGGQPQYMWFPALYVRIS